MNKLSLNKRWLAEPLFDPECRRCKRLTGYLKKVHTQHEDYHCAPVASFGSGQPRLLVVGLAPGKHGANRTGRPFTGDYAGEVLYEALYQGGFSNQPLASAADDGLRLYDCRITNAVKCLPPDNKPASDEIKQCNAFLQAELKVLSAGTVVLALGQIAHRAVISALNLRQALYPFTHGKSWQLDDGLQLLDSYHCSRYNVNTRRLTRRQFINVINKAKRLLEQTA